MKVNNNKDILHYPEHTQENSKIFSKRVSVQEFKTIDNQRIHQEFNVLFFTQRPSEVPTLPTPKTPFISITKKTRIGILMSLHVFINPFR